MSGENKVGGKMRGGWKHVALVLVEKLGGTASIKKEDLFSEKVIETEDSGECLILTVSDRKVCHCMVCGRLMDTELEYCGICRERWAKVL